MNKYIFAFVFFLAFESVFGQTCEEAFSTNINSMVNNCGIGYPTCGNAGGVYTTTNVTSTLQQGARAVLVSCRIYDCATDTFISGGDNVFAFCDDNANSSASTASRRIDKPADQCGSIVQIENQTIGESIPLVGVGFSMNYFTHWAQGRAGDYKLTVPLAGATPRDDITSFDVEVKDGATTVQSTSYTNNQSDVSFSHTWNGLDGSNNPMIGTKTFQVTVTENRPGGSIPVVSAVAVGSFKAKLLGLGGWVPSVFNFYDSNSHTLYKGDGSRRSVVASVWNTTGFMVSEEDASLVYYFDSTGRHVYTKTGLTGVAVYTFNYDGQGRLTSIDEPFSRTTTFDRSSGIFVSITSPKGQVTTVSLDANDYATSFTNPNSEVYSMTYSGTLGLLATFTKPGGQVSTFTYDSDKNLIKDEHSGGYFFEIEKNISSYSLDYSKMTKMSRESTYHGSGSGSSVSRTTLLPSGGSETYSYSQGTGSASEASSVKGYSVYNSYVDDVRFGSMANFKSNSSIQYGSVDQPGVLLPVTLLTIYLQAS